MNLLFWLDGREVKVLIKVYLNIVDAVQHFTLYLHKTASTSVTQSGKIKKDFGRQTGGLGILSKPWNCQWVLAFQAVVFYWLKNRKKMEQ